jgi:transposase, IS5 family
VKYRVLEIGRASRSKNGNGREKLKELYQKLLSTIGRVVGQAQRFVHEIAEGVKRSSDVRMQTALEGLQKQIEVMLPRLQQAMRQT